MCVCVCVCVFVYYRALATKATGGAGQNTQFADYRAAGRFCAPRGETLLLFPPRHSKTFMASKRARGTAGDRQWVRVVRGKGPTLSPGTHLQPHGDRAAASGAVWNVAA